MQEAFICTMRLIVYGIYLYGSQNENDSSMVRNSKVEMSYIVNSFEYRLACGKTHITSLFVKMRESFTSIKISFIFTSYKFVVLARVTTLLAFDFFRRKAEVNRHTKTGLFPSRMLSVLTNLLVFLRCVGVRETSH